MKDLEVVTFFTWYKNFSGYSY